MLTENTSSSKKNKKNVVKNKMVDENSAGNKEVQTDNCFPSDSQTSQTVMVLASRYYQVVGRTGMTPPIGGSPRFHPKNGLFRK